MVQKRLTSPPFCDILTCVSSILGYSQAVKARDFDSRIRWFKSNYPSQKRSNFCLPKVTSFFIQAAGLAYHHRAKCGVYHQPLWGCISSRVSVHLPTAWWYTTLRVDDIPQQVADDMQGLRLDLFTIVWHNGFVENPEFVEKIATASCLSTPATRDII